MPINDRQANLDARTRLVTELRTGRLLSLTGAGLSAWAGYPTWQSFLAKVMNIVRTKEGSEIVIGQAEGITDPLVKARRLASFLGAEFEQIFRDEFGPRNTHPDEVLFRFVALPFRHHTTLNFDPSIALALAAIYRPHDVLTSVRREDLITFLRDANLADYTQQVFHLHGRHDDPIDQIVLTEPGYTAHYADNALRKHFLWNLFATHRLVFTGFGYTDADFLHSLRECCRHTRIEPGLRHFAIVPLWGTDNDLGKRVDLADAYDTDAVFYEVQEDAQGLDQHHKFKELIVGIATELNIHTPQKVIPALHPEGTVADPEDIRIVHEVTARTRGGLGRGLPNV
jgi:hypothetical protein